MKTTIGILPLALFLSQAPLGAAIVFDDTMAGTAGQSISVYDGDYSISTNNVATWTEEISGDGSAAFFSQENSTGGSGHITASNSADFTTTTFADSRYLYATASFYVADAADFVDDGSNIGVTIDFDDHQDVRFGIRKDGGSLYAYAHTNGRASANIAPYTAGTEMIVAIMYDGESSSWATRPVFGATDPGMTEPSWGGELVDQSNSNTAHTVSGMSLGVEWPASWGNPLGVAGEISNIRIGTTWDDVAQVPEPAHYAAIFGCLGLAFVIWRRRR